jgi:hypothetical protein
VAGCGAVRATRGLVAELLGVARSFEHSLHQVMRLVEADRPVVRVQAGKHADPRFVAVGRGATSRLPAPPGRVVLGHVAGYGLGTRSGVAF